jgi:hypothetical protein
MSEFVQLEQDSSEYIALEDGDLLILENEEIVVDEEVTATTLFPSFSTHNVCDRSGVKAYPGELIVDPYSGNMVLKRYADEPQQETRAFSSNPARGSQRPEKDDLFITTSVTPESL